jgi:hypothetical protein
VILGRYKYTPLGLVPDPRRVQVDIATAKLKSKNSPGSDKVPAELIKQEVKNYCLQSINSLILFGIRKSCLIIERNLLLYQFTKRAIKLTVVIILGYRFYQLHTKFYRISYSRG